jgi:hypothetical protein
LCENALSHFDADEKVMASHNLVYKYVLAENKKLDETEENMVVNAIVSQLNDELNEVKNEAVGFISLIINNISDRNFANVAESLAKFILDVNSPIRDVLVTCMRTIISESKEEKAPLLLRTIMPYIKSGLDPS